jgi:hypothetical protein
MAISQLVAVHRLFRAGINPHLYKKDEMDTKNDEWIVGGGWFRWVRFGACKFFLGG